MNSDLRKIIKQNLICRKARLIYLEYHIIKLKKMEIAIIMAMLGFE